MNHNDDMNTRTHIRIRHGRWTATYVGNGDEMLTTTWTGRGNKVGENAEGFFASKPLAARKVGRGLGARKRRMREQRLLRLRVLQERGHRTYGRRALGER